MDIGNITSQFQKMTQPVQDAPSGQFGGQQVTVNDPISLILNSAEEASFAMSEREEARLEERKMKPKGPGTERVEQVEQYLELMDKQGKKKDLDAFIKSLSNTPSLDSKEAVTTALKYFDDKADAYAALQYAQRELEEKFDKSLFPEAMDQLEDIHGREIKTRLASGIAALEHETLGSPDKLKDLYSETIGDLGSPADIYEKIMTDYGEDRFEEALAFLTRSLGNDMAATTVSTDKVQLESIGRDLGVVQLLHGLNAQCKTLAARVEKIQEKCSLTSTQLVKEVLKLRDMNFIGPFDIEEIADKAGVKLLENRIQFFQEFSNIARDFSENIFPDPNVRLNIIEAIQTALDDAISVEDEMYDD